MPWCTVWRGTPQDCIDHMRRDHIVPATVKAANLARWFSPWTVSRERWSTVLRSSISGVATDTLLFSRIGLPLVHRYRVLLARVLICLDFGPFSTLPMLHVCSPVIDVAPGRLHPRCLRRFRWGGRSREPANLSQPSKSRRPFSASTSVAAIAPESSTPVVVRSRRFDRRAVSVPIDLALPHFAAPDFQSSGSVGM